MNTENLNPCPLERRVGRADEATTLNVQGFGSSLPCQLPYSLYCNWGSGRRFYVPSPVANPDGFNHLVGRSLVPTNTYLLEIDKVLVRCTSSNKLSTKKWIRVEVERTCGIKFKNGSRGFMQRFLKHLTPTFVSNVSKTQHFRKQRRSKINKPSFSLNPTVKRVVLDRRVAIDFICKSKNNLIKFIEVVYSPSCYGVGI